MQIERGRRNENTSGQVLSEKFVDGVAFRARESSSSPSRCSRLMSPTGTNSIEHRVSKMDTLAGIAIKYGVEVADIKRMNGLVTDLQMFAHKKLHIPLPGRHPPSQNVSNDLSSNGEELTPPRKRQSDVLETFQSLRLISTNKSVSQAMSSLQGYYGLTPKQCSVVDSTDMPVYRNGNTLNIDDRSRRTSSSPASEPPLGVHRKSRSFANGFHPENNGTVEDQVISDFGDRLEADRSFSEKAVRRRQKNDIDPTCHTPEILLRDESGGAFSGRTGKSLAPRPKSGSRTDSDSSHLMGMPVGNPTMGDGFISVRKSSSTSNLQESDGSSLWSTTKWNLKADNISKPIFDGLPKPMTSRRNKAAID